MPGTYIVLRIVNVIVKGEVDMNKKMYSFQFSQSGLEEAKDFRETNVKVKTAVAIIAVIGITCLVCAAPASTVAFKPIAVEAAKEALKLTVSGGAI